MFRDGGTKGASGAQAPSDNGDQSTLSQPEGDRLCPPLLSVLSEYLKILALLPAFQTFRHLWTVSCHGEPTNQPSNELYMAAAQF